MRLRKRYVVALFGAALLLFLGIKYSLEWRTEFVSASQSLDHARVALAEGDSARGIVYLDQGLERASQDPEELSALIFEELGILDGAPPMHVQDAARLYRYRIDLQKRNCATQTWEKVLIKSVESLHWPEEEASAHFHMLHPGRELLEMSIARAETLDTFAAWNLGREIGQQLKDSGAVPEWAHVLRAMANLKACELDAMGTVNITVAPIMGWVRDAIIARPDDPQLQRAMDVSLAIASGDDRLADRILPRENPLVEAVSLSDAFAKEYPDCIPGLVNQIETRVRATELAAIQSEPDAQKLLDQFVANCPSEANWRDVLRAVGLQVRALAFQDPGSPDYAHGIANVRRLAGSLLERAPGAPDALLALGRLYRVLGQDATARDYFHQAAESKVLCSPSLRALTWDLSGGLAELELVDMDLLVLEGTSSPAVGDLPPITTRIDRAAERLGAGNGDVLLARGRVALLAGQPRIAVALLEKACERLGKLRPKAFLVSGATLTNLGEWGSAEKRLELYLSLPGTRAEQRLPGARKLAEALLRTHSPDEASLRIAKLTAAYPGDEELQLARARAVLHNALQTSANRVSRAARLAEVTAILDPLTATGNEAALLLAARSQALLGEGRDSMLGLETFCRNHPRNEAGIEDWCQALRLRGELDAEEQAIRSLVVPQASPPVRAMLTWALERKTRPRSVLDPLVKLAFVPDEAEQQLGLFWVHWGLDDSEACGKALAAGLAAAPHDAGLLGANLAFLLDAGKATAARQALGNLPDAAIPAWQRQLWQAKVLLAVREQEKAKRLLDSLAKEYPHLSEAIALQGVLSMQSGQTAAATLQFENALRVNPLQPIALDGMTRIAIDGHEPVLAFGYLRKLVRLGTPSQPRFTAQLLDQLTLCGTLTGSIRLREHLREQSPWDRANLRELALLHLKSRQIGQATEILRQLTHDDPSDLATAVLLARTLREQTLGGEARDLLVAAAAASADPATDPESLAVAGMLEELGASQAAQDLLAKASQGQGAIATAATIRLGNLLYHGQQWAKAASTYAALPDAQTRPDLLRREVECRIRTGELPQAKALLDNLQRLEPNQPLSHVLAAELALASGDLAWARSACAQAFAQDPGCALAFLMRARIALRGDGGKKALDGAVDDLQKACLRDPTLTDARELLVRLLLEQGRPNEAAATLRLLIGARPNDHRLKLALARLLLEIGQRTTLDSLLRRWQYDAPDEPFWSRIEGMLAMQQGDPLKAAHAYSHNFAKTGDTASLLAAVDAYLAASQPAEAERLCSQLPPALAARPEGMVAKARVLAATDPAQARDLLSQALRGVQDQARGERLLRQARKALPPAELVAVLQELHAASPSRPIALALADVWESSGKGAQAADLLRALADKATGNDRSELLARLAAAEYAAGHVTQAEAGLRQALALAPNDPALLNNAAHLALAEGNRNAEAVRLAKKAVAASVEDRDLHACALATLAEGLFRLRLLDQARDALLKALAIHDNPEDRLLLGRALLADGQSLKGAAQLRRAKEQAEQEGKTELAKKIAALL